MDRPEFDNLVQQIGTAETEEDRRALLGQLTDGASSMFDDNERLTRENENLATRLSEAQDRNLDLFRRVGVNKNNQIDPDKDPENNPENKLKYENLFDENGRLK